MGKGKKKQNQNQNRNQNQNGEDTITTDTTTPNDKQQKEAKQQKEEKYLVAVLKADFHCYGCTRRIMKYILSFKGVVSAKEELDKSTVTVCGGFDPVELAMKVQKKTGKNIQVVSPSHKKEKNNGNVATAAATGSLGGDEQQQTDGKKNNSNNAKPKENVEKKEKKQQPPVMITVVLKLQWHCEGCAQKIQRIISSYKGVEKVVMDKEKELITVTGAMDQKALVEHLQRKFKRSVQIVPEKKGKENGDAKEEKQQQAGEKKNKKGGGGGGGEEMKKGPVEYLVYGSGYQCRDTATGYVVDLFYPPQLFSEENPTGCSVM